MKFILVFFLMCTVAPTTASGKTILVVLSGESKLVLKDGKSYPTGFYLNELMVPVNELIKHDHKIVFATPEGKLPSLDQASDDAKYFGSVIEYQEAQKALKAINLLDKEKSPVVSLEKINQAGIEDFAGVFVPGGHAPMIDLAYDRNLGSILRKIHASNKPTALICHGPVSLLSTLDNPKAVIIDNENPGDWIYKNYKMTVYSDSEEIYTEIKKLNGKVPFYPESTLKKAGGSLQTEKNWKSNVVQDKELITGQNPASVEEVVKVFIKRLE